MPKYLNLKNVANGKLISLVSFAESGVKQIMDN